MDSPHRTRAPRGCAPLRTGNGLAARVTPAALALLAVLGGQADRAAADQNELSWLRIERMDVGPSVLEDYA